jgi:hypothetical protein
MVEWFPHELVNSTLYPSGPEKCLNVIEFYYPEESAPFEPDFMKAQQKAYHETALQDEQIYLRMTAPRKTLLEDGREEYGPHQSPMEGGVGWCISMSLSGGRLGSMSDALARGRIRLALRLQSDFIFQSIKAPLT